MRVIDGTCGNVETDPDLACARDRHREQGTLEHLRIDDTQRRKSRFRASTDAGTELGIVVPGSTPLSPGDVLLEADVMIVVELAETAALAVTFPDGVAATTAVLVGHAAGNRHWDLAVDAGAVYVPAGPDPDARRERLEDVAPERTRIERTTVDPSLFDETRDGAHDGATDAQNTDAAGGRNHSHEHSNHASVEVSEDE